MTAGKFSKRPVSGKGMNNVFDVEPPFVAAALENGYDESTANIKGRTWYVALTKRF